MARPISDHNRRWLSGELAEWVSAGLLDTDQSQRILGHYETPADLADRKRWLVSVSLAAVAVLLMGMAVLLIVSHNWDLVVRGWEMLPRLGKVVAVLAVLLVSHGVAWYLRVRSRWRMASELTFLFAGLMYGAGIWMIAQVFHVNAHYPDGLWWWALGVLPLALCLDSLVLHGLLVGLLAIWVGCETMGFPNSRVFWHLLPNGAYSLLPLAGLGLAWCYRKGSVWGVWLYTALISWWLIMHSLSMGNLFWGREEASIYFLAMSGPLFLILGENHRRASPMAVPYYCAGMLLTAAAVIPLSYESFHEHLRYGYGYRIAGAPAGMISAAAVLAILAVLAATFTLFRSPTAQQTAAGPLARLGDLLRRQAVPVAVTLLATCMALWDAATLGQSPLLPTVLGNLAMFGLAIWLMHTGVRDEHGFVFAAGVGYLLLWAVCRYVDLFADFGGMLGGALMFFLCGVLMLVLARVWRNRKEIFHA
mgnify:FL=1